MVTIHGELVAKEHDLMGYITYVFRNLDDAPFGKQFIMCIRFKNWEHRNIDIGEIGYLTYREVEEGKDHWYDRDTNTFIPYNYTNLIFIKFVKAVDNSKKDIII